MTTSWTIAIDWDRDGNFSDDNDDVTSRVISAQWFIGSRMPYQNAANDSTLQLELNNEDRLYSPDYFDPPLPPGHVSQSPLYGKLMPQRPVRISSVTTVTDVNGNQVVDADGDPLVITHTHWVGWTESIQPATGQYGERTVQILATGAMQYLKAAEANVPLQENKRTDEIVNLLIQEVVMPPALTSAWVLGRDGYGNLGQSTYLADLTADSQLEEGKLTLALAADNWIQHGGPNDISQNNFDVYHAIGDVTAAERGRFFFDRAGRAICWNRHHLLYDWPVAARTRSLLSRTAASGRPTIVNVGMAVRALKSTSTSTT